MLFSNSLIKKLKKQLLSINQLIESFFNRFQNILKSKKRYKFIDIDKKVFFCCGFYCHNNVHLFFNTILL